MPRLWWFCGSIKGLEKVVSGEVVQKFHRAYCHDYHKVLILKHYLLRLCTRAGTPHEGS